jgi:hypothetical protein
MPIAHDDKWLPLYGVAPIAFVSLAMYSAALGHEAAMTHIRYNYGFLAAELTATVLIVGSLAYLGLRRTAWAALVAIGIAGTVGTLYIIFDDGYRHQIVAALEHQKRTGRTNAPPVLPESLRVPKVGKNPTQGRHKI